MNRRSFMGMLGCLPFLGGLKPKLIQKGWPPRTATSETILMDLEQQREEILREHIELHYSIFKLRGCATSVERKHMHRHVREHQQVCKLIRSKWNVQTPN